MLDAYFPTGIPFKCRLRRLTRSARRFLCGACGQAAERFRQPAANFMTIPVASQGLFALTRKLVDIDSVTGNEGEAARFAAAHLQRIGFAVEWMPVSPGRANVLALHGAPEVMLSTHLDTVPPFMPSSEDEEYIYGRGACDAKGIAAAQMLAAERLRQEGMEDFGVMFLVGEETVSDGATTANLAPRGTRYMVNGEPTENRLALGSKGILRVDLRARGRMAHSAYPHLGVSAIDALLDVLADLRRMPLPHDPVLGQATLNIGLIAGGRAANVVPDQASAQVLIRTVPQAPGARPLRPRVEELLAGRCDYEFLRETPPLRMERVDGFATDVVAFTTDLPSLTRWGLPLLIGPGSIHVAHTDHERVAKAELVDAVGHYCRLVRELKARCRSGAAAGV